jgi:hypothetical protein
MVYIAVFVDKAASSEAGLTKLISLSTMSPKRKFIMEDVMMTTYCMDCSI